MNSIYISEPIHPEVLREISAKAETFLGFGPSAVTYESVANRVEAVLLRSERFPAERIEAGKRLKVIARHGAGVDTVDLDAAARCGVPVTYCPGGNANAVAEHVFAMALTLGRKIIAGYSDLKSGTWPRAKQHLVGTELGRRTLGIVGFGEIGKLVSCIAAGFDMKVLVSDPFLRGQDLSAYHAQLVELDELLEQSHVISLHAPLTPATQNLINAERLQIMRPDVVIINTARSGLIDEKALVAALSLGRIAGAALDVAHAEVTPTEPVMFGGRRLDEIPNLLLTPHIAGQTDESLLRVGSTAWADIQAVLAGEEPRYPVNIPKKAP